MIQSIRAIGVCNGGGDYPGLNAAIRAVVRKIESVPLADAVGAANLVDPKSDYVRAAHAMGITFGDRP